MRARYISQRGVPILLALVMLLLTSTVTAQQNSVTGELRGKVIAQENGEPIIRATVALVGTKFGAISDLKGTYTVRNVPSGSMSTSSVPIH